MGRTKRKHMWVISTDKRPVPLQHFLWCKHKLFQVLDGTSGKFLSEGFKAARNEGLTDKVRRHTHARRFLFLFSFSFFFGTYPFYKFIQRLPPSQ